jgi:hypothetical protein
VDCVEDCLFVRVGDFEAGVAVSVVEVEFAVGVHCDGNVWRIGMVGCIQG